MWINLAQSEKTYSGYYEGIFLSSRSRLVAYLLNKSMKISCDPELDSLLKRVRHAEHQFERLANSEKSFSDNRRTKPNNDYSLLIVTTKI